MKYGKYNIDVYYRAGDGAWRVFTPHAPIKTIAAAKKVAAGIIKKAKQGKYPVLPGSIQLMEYNQLRIAWSLVQDGDRLYYKKSGR